MQKSSIPSTGVQNGMDVVGSAVTEPLATTGDVTTYMWHISHSARIRKQSYESSECIIYQTQAAQIVANGLEGLEYELDENGQMMMYPEGKTMADIGWPAASMAYWPNVTLCKTWNYEAEDIYESDEEKMKMLKNPFALGFSLIPAKLQIK